MKIRSVLLLALALCGCREARYTVVGTNGLLPGDSVCLFACDRTILNAGTVGPDSTFTLRGRLSAPAIVELGDRDHLCRPVRFLLEPGTIRIEADAAGFAASGTPLNDSLRSMTQRLHALAGRCAPPLSAEASVRHRTARDSIVRLTVRTHRDDLLGVLLLADRLSDDEADAAAWQAETELLPDGLRCHPLLAALRGRAAAAEEIRPGKPAPPLTLPDSSGDLRPLSALTEAGRWVLLDFRASWCRTCMRGLPALQQTYAHYRDSGFDIYTVWLDNDPAGWKSAVRHRGLHWTNVGGTAPDKRSEAAERYGIVALPANLLISPEGLIEAQNLDDKMLRRVLSARTGKKTE